MFRHEFRITTSDFHLRRVSSTRSYTLASTTRQLSKRPDELRKRWLSSHHTYSKLNPCSQSKSRYDTTIGGIIKNDRPAQT